MRRIYKNLKRRYARNFYYGRLTNKMDRLSMPLTEFVVNYFDAYAPFDYLDADFANRLSMEGSVGPTTLIVAMIYLERLRMLDKHHFETSDPQDLFSSALLCASKYLYDNDDEEFVYNDEWAASCSKSLTYINEKEVEFLNSIAWNIIAREHEFDHVLTMIERRVAWKESSKRNFFTYADLTSICECDDIKNYLTNEILIPFVKAVCVAATFYSTMIFGVYALSLHLSTISTSAFSSNCRLPAVEFKMGLPCPTFSHEIERNAPPTTNVVERDENIFVAPKHSFLFFQSPETSETKIRPSPVFRRPQPLLCLNDKNLYNVDFFSNVTLNDTKSLFAGAFRFNFGFRFA